MSNADFEESFVVSELSSFADSLEKYCLWVHNEHYLAPISVQRLFSTE